MHARVRYEKVRGRQYEIAVGENVQVKASRAESDFPGSVAPALSFKSVECIKEPVRGQQCETEHNLVAVPRLIGTVMRITPQERGDSCFIEHRLESGAGPPECLFRRTNGSGNVGAETDQDFDPPHDA